MRHPKWVTAEVIGHPAIPNTVGCIDNGCAARSLLNHLKPGSDSIDELGIACLLIAHCFYVECGRQISCFQRHGLEEQLGLLGGIFESAEVMVSAANESRVLHILPIRCKLRID